MLHPAAPGNVRFLDSSFFALGPHRVNGLHRSRGSLWPPAVRSARLRRLLISCVRRSRGEARCRDPGVAATAAFEMAAISGNISLTLLFS